MDIDPKAAATGGGVLATAIGWLLNRVYRGLSHRIEEGRQQISAVKSAVEEAENRRRTDVIDIHQKLDSHIQRDVTMHESMLMALRDQTQMLGSIHASLERALGDRPTREEVNKLIKLYQGAKT